MEHYVTLFDSKYLPHGVALYRSMEKWCGDFTLWVVAMDEATQQVLMNLDLPACRVIALADIETDRMLHVKDGRTAGEYCWTLTPFTPGLVFERDRSAMRVTYLDADIWFRDSPQRVFDEFEKSGASVLLTEHGYSPENDTSERTGIFCVQFMTFIRDESREIEANWQDLCIDWCFARFEDSKFGDQKYLDNWPKKYAELVHVVSNKEWFQAPWNATRFPYSEAIAFHFSGLQLLTDNSAVLGAYVLNLPLIQNVYHPYLKSLEESISQIANLNVEVTPEWIRANSRSRLENRYRYWRRRLRLSVGPSYLSV